MCMYICVYLYTQIFWKQDVQSKLFYGQDKAALRDRLKSRKFHEIFDSLSEDVREKYRKAGELRGGQARKAQSDFINTLMIREGRNIVAVPENPVFTEFLKHSLNKFQDEFAQGIVLNFHKNYTADC